MNALPKAGNANPRRPALLLAALLLAVTAGPGLAKDKDQGPGYLGVMLQNVTTSMAKALQLDEGQGVMINEVVEGGPAEQAGLEAGDVVLKFAGNAINDYGALTKAVRATAPGDKVKLEILREGKKKTVEVVMGEGKERSYSYTIERDGDGDEPHVEFFGEGGDHEVIVLPGGGHKNVWFSDDDSEGLKELHLEMLGERADRGYLGVELGDLNEQLGEYFGVADGQGALVNSVRKDSPAAKAGLKAGDVITGVGGEAVTDAGDVHAALADTKPDQQVEVEFVRKGSRKSEQVKLGEVPEGELSFNMKMPHMLRKFKHDFNFKDGDHDIRVIAPEVGRRIREVHRLREESPELDELRTQMDELRKELKELQKELKK